MNNSSLFYQILLLNKTNIPFDFTLKINCIRREERNHRSYKDPLSNTCKIKHNMRLSDNSNINEFTCVSARLLAGWKMIEPTKARIIPIKPIFLRIIDDYL